MTYSATNAKSCMVGGAKFPASGSATLGPYSAGKHSLTFSCSGDGGTTSHTINWEAISRVSISASVSPSTVKANGSDTVRVSWTGSNADSCKLDGANAPTSGSKTFGPYSYSQAGTKSATVSCANRLGSASDSVSWKAEAPKPVVSATLSKYTVTAGVDRVNLSWTSSNADSCSYDGRTRTVNGTIRNLGPFTAGTHNFMVSCTGTGGTTSDTAMLTAEKAPDPPTVTVSLNPESIIASTGTATLSWSSTDATSCTRDSRAVATSGNASVGPYTQGSYDFTVSCTGPGGNASGMATLTVEPQPDPPTVTLRLNPSTIDAGSDTSTLTWSSRNATSCSRDGTAVATSGSVTVGPYATAGTRRFTVSCDGPGGSDSETRTLTVERPDPPRVSVSLNPEKIAANTGKSTLTWSSRNATSCKRGTASVATSGSASVGPYAAGTRSFTVTCTGSGGSDSDTAVLTMAPLPTVTVSLSKTTIAADKDTVDLTWSSTDAASCKYGSTSLATSGKRTIGPFAAGTHDIAVSCTGAGGKASGAASLTAIAEPTVSAGFSPATVVSHTGQTTLTWSSTGATACRLGDRTTLSTDGKLEGIGPFYDGSHDFTITCENSLGNETSTTSTVTAQASPVSLCSTHTPAPRVASTLSRGTYTYSVTGSNSGSVWGTGTYTADSDIATAAVHAGHVKVGGKAIIVLNRIAGLSSYSGSIQNGVVSGSHGAAAGSYNISLTGACRESPPTAPENLLATPNPSLDGNLELTWDAPSSGTSPTGYLVYRANDGISPIIKNFSDSSLKLAGLNNGSWVFKVFACAGTESKPDCGSSGDIAVTVSSPDTDGDGIADSQDKDDDNDGMPDACEKSFGFNPLSPTDGGDTDTDNDGVSNVDECAAGTDLRRRELLGFDNMYVAYGKANSNDIYIARIFNNSVVPGVAGFYLQESKESTHFYNIVQQVSDKEAMDDGFNLTQHLPLDLEIAELNLDDVPDLYIGGLEDEVIGRSNVLVYGGKIAGGNTLGYTEFDEEFVQFLQELGGYLANEKYFEEKAEENKWFEEEDQVDSALSTAPQEKRYDYSNFNQDSYKLSLEIDAISKNGLSSNSNWVTVVEGYYGIPGMFNNLIRARCGIVCIDIPYPGEFGWSEWFWPVFIYIILMMHDFTEAQEIISHDLIDHFFHYTNRRAAISIASSRRLGIIPGTGYLTKDYYDNEREVRRDLAICETPINAYVLFVFSAEKGAFDNPVSGPSKVAQVTCSNREFLHGGGREWTVKTPAFATGRVWQFDF